jgi:hypothetical protein
LEFSQPNSVTNRLADRWMSIAGARSVAVIVQVFPR